MPRNKNISRGGDTFRKDDRIAKRAQEAANLRRSVIKLLHMKIRTSAKNVSPVGGINFIIQHTIQAGIPALIDASLPGRHANSKYSYSDAIIGTVYGVFCGAQRLEDMAVVKSMTHNEALNIPSPDNIGVIFKDKLASKGFVVKSKEGAHEVNSNATLNNMLLSMAVSLGQIHAGNGHTLDYDNTCIPCEKTDSQWTYKKFRGYQPGVCFIKDTPVYIEGMNGNNPAFFDQENTIQRAVDALNSKGIEVSRFRADNASYQHEVVKMFDKDGCDFFIRASANTEMWDDIADLKTWKEVRIKNDTMELADFEFVPFKGKKGNTTPYRMVTSRRKVSEVHKHTGEKYIYRTIVTNNRTMSNADVVATYNSRGRCERVFDQLNNDWNWSRLPFSKLGENTAYMIVMAMGMVIYNYLVKVFAGMADFVKPEWRLKAFRLHVIMVSAQWEGETLIIFDTTRDWERLCNRK